MTKYHIGIDLHKTVAQVCAVDEAGEVAEEFRHALKDSAAGDALVGRLAGAWPGARAAVEALGCNRWFVRRARAAGLDVVVVHAAALGLKQKGRKTDRRDAREIARRLRLGDLDRHARSYFAPDEEFGRRKLLRIRQRQVRRRVQAVNQIRALLNAELLRPPTRTLASRRARRWLREVELPSPDATFALRVLVDDLEAVMAQVAALDERIRALRADPKVAALEESLPLVGVQSAATLLCELGDVRRFERSRQITAFAGLAPRVSQSGEGAAHHGRLDKRGNPRLRWILCQWAVRLLARDPVAAAWAARHRRRLHKNKIRIDLARRLLLGVSWTLRTGEVFSLKRCLGLPRAA